MTRRIVPVPKTMTELVELAERLRAEGITRLWISPKTYGEILEEKYSEPVLPQTGTVIPIATAHVIVDETVEDGVYALDPPKEAENDG